MPVAPGMLGLVKRAVHSRIGTDTTNSRLETGEDMVKAFDNYVRGTCRMLSGFIGEEFSMRIDGQKRSGWILGVVVAAWFAGSQILIAEDVEPNLLDSPAAPTEQSDLLDQQQEEDLDPVQRQQLQDLLRIRRQLNLGQLLDQAFSPADENKSDVQNKGVLEEVFREALKEVYGEELKPRNDSPRAAIYRNRPEPPRREGSEPSAALLQASRNLDQQVHELDQEGKFFESDRLRELANQLRIEARQSSGGENDPP